MPDSFDLLLSVRDLCVSFRTRLGLVHAVDRLSFDIRQGEVLGVVGESGSGKSVSMLAVMGLITDPNAIVEGSMVFRGQELVGLPQKRMRAIRGRDIAMIFQDPMTALTPVYTIGWQIIEQIQAHQSVSKKAARLQARELLGAVGMPNPDAQLDRFPHQLSGGMRQRAVIAMALTCRPALLIADEPTTALDVTVQAQILDVLDHMRKTVGSAVILITHDMGVVAELAERVMVMYAGRAAEDGTASNLFNDPWHPYTWGLLGSIPPLTGPKPRRLLSIAGAPPSLNSVPAGCAFAPRCPSRFDLCSKRPVLSGVLQHHAACFLDEDARRLARPVLTTDDRKSR
jgi:peptide/nickel transport system ATP-binding protein